MNLILLGGSNWFYEIWNTLWLWVCSGIYYFIGLLYQVFEKVASVNLFNGEIFEKLTGRMYLVIGIAMLFILAYNIILAIINPDGKDKGTSQMTKVVKETIISLVLVVLLPTIFNYLYIFQTHVLESNIIGTIILGGVGSSGSGGNCEPTDYDCNCEFPSDAFSSYNNYDRWLIFFKDYSTSDITPLLEAKCVEYRDNRTQSQKGAYMVAPSVFSAFYRPTQFDFEECSDHIMGFSTSSVINGNEENEKICVNFFADVLLSKYTGNIAPFASDSYLTSVISDSAKNGVYMDFHWIMAIVAGILALYMFFCYAMEIGVRVAKLGFLQLISPIPVMMRIIPGQKEKIYKKWFDNLKNTYIDVFIRLAIIYFALFGVSLVPDVIGTMFNSVWNDETNFFIKLLVQVFVILGLLKFAQDAPQLFKEFFGGVGKGNFSLNPKKNAAANMLKGGIYGATTGQGWGRLSGFARGAFGGAMHGYDKSVKSLDTLRTEKANGSTFGGRMLDRTRAAIGMETRAEADERRVKREVESKFATKDRTELNKTVMDRVKGAEDYTSNLLAKGNSEFKFKLDGIPGSSELNLHKHTEYLEFLKNRAKTTGNDDDWKKAMEYESELEKAKKMQIARVITLLNHNSKIEQKQPDGSTKKVTAAEFFSVKDVKKIQADFQVINQLISEGNVARILDDNGSTIEVWDKPIENGSQLLSGDSSLKSKLELQSSEIAKHGTVAKSSKYGKYKADSNIVRGQGQSEKK